MNWEEIKTKYGTEKVKFYSYYKYTFTFKNNNGFTVCCGGMADDIYRFSVTVDDEYTLETLEPNCILLNGETIFEDY